MRDPFAQAGALEGGNLGHVEIPVAVHAAAPAEVNVYRRSLMICPR